MSALITQVYGIMAQNECLPTSLPAIYYWQNFYLQIFYCHGEYGWQNVIAIVDMNTDTTTTLYQSS